MNNFGEENKEEINNSPEGSVFDQPVEHMDERPAKPTPPVEPPTAPQPIAQPFQPLPEAPITPIASAPVAEKKSHKGLVATIIILAVLLLAAAGYIVYTSFFAKNADESAKTASTTSTTQSQTPTSPNAQAVVDTIRTAITDNLAKTYPNMTITGSTYAPIYKPEAAPYAVMSSTLGHGLDILPVLTSATSDFSSSTKVEQVIADSFTAQKGFTKTAVDWKTTYQNSAVICEVSISTQPVSINCADKSIYSDLVGVLKPFATAYLASSQGKQYGDGVALGEPKVTQKSAGYANAVLNMGNTNSPVGGFAGLFYEKDGVWTYWQGTQQIISCSDYNTHDLQKAFEGDSCYDATSKNDSATVKVTL